jgi:pentatricopeptide repeat protein
MLKEINRTNVERAIETYYDIKKNRLSDYDFSESELNSLGYLLLRQNRINEAIRIFKENVNLFPDSWNVYDSLAEACMRNNDLEKAIYYYSESLRLNPDNENAETMLREIRK